MLVTVPIVILCLSQHQLWYYACHGTYCDTMLVTAPIVILCLSRYQLWYYACHSTNCDTMLVTVPIVILCLSRYQLWRVQHHGTISNIYGCYTSSNIRWISCSRYEGFFIIQTAYSFQSIIEAQERDREKSCNSHPQSHRVTASEWPEGSEAKCPLVYPGPEADEILNGAMNMESTWLGTYGSI